MLGNGSAAAFDFLIIAVLLLLFSVGFTAMSTHITNAGAFYAYISMGLGKRFGTAAGFVAVAAYNLLSVYLVSAGGTFGIFDHRDGIGDLHSLVGDFPGVCRHHPHFFVFWH